MISFLRQRIKFFCLIVFFIIISSSYNAKADPSYLNYVDTSINVSISPKLILINYYVHFSDQNAFPIITEMATDSLGNITEASKSSEATSLCSNFFPKMSFSIAELSFKLDNRVTSLELLPSASGFSSIILNCQFSENLEFNGKKLFSFTDLNTYDAPGFHEFNFNAVEGVTSDSTFPISSASNFLAQYSAESLNSNVRSASFYLKYKKLNSLSKVHSPNELAPLDTGKGQYRSSPLITELKSKTLLSSDSETSSLNSFLNRLSNQYLHARHVTVLIFILGIFLAFVLGAFHSLAPGHGKAIMVAVALAEKGKRRDVIQLAVTMGLTHTVGVFVLAVIVFIGFTNSTYAVLKYLSFLSGVAIAITGLAFLLQRSRLFLNGSQTSNMHFDDHDHPHDHSHDHPHPHVPTTQTGISARRIALMGIAGGMVPTPSALTIILGTASLGTAWYGIILVIAYGLGMSSVLILAGYTMMKIYSTLERSLKPSTKFGKLLKLVPITTAAFQIAAGIFLIYISRVWQLWSL